MIRCVFRRVSYIETVEGIIMHKKNVLWAMGIAFVLLIPMGMCSITIPTSSIHISQHDGTTFSKTIDVNVNSINKTYWLKTGIYLPNFETSIVPKEIISTNETKTYHFVFSGEIPSGYNTGTYTGHLVFYTEDWNKTIPIDVEVLRNTNFTVDFPSNIELFTDSVGTIEGELTNIGNDDFNVSINSNSTLFDDISVMSYRQTTMKIFVPYSVNESETPGTRGVVFNFNDMEIPVNVTIVDNIKPDISIVSLGNISVAKDSTAIVESTDNIAIQKVYADMSCDYRSERINFTKVGDEWRGEIKGFDQPQDCIIDFFAVDTSGNINSVNSSFSVSYLKKFNVRDDIDFMKFKTDTQRTSDLIDSEEYVNVTLMLEYAKLTDLNNEEHNFTASGLEVGVKTTAGIKWFSDIGDTIQVEDKDVDLVVKGSLQGKFEGSIKAEIPKGYVKNTNQTISFYGRITTYNTYPDYSGEQLGYFINCTTIDKGSLDESYTQCILRTPNGNVQDPRLMNFPVSIESLKDKEQKYEEQIRAANEEAQTNLYAAEGVTAVFIIFVLVVSYFMFVKPRL